MSDEHKQALSVGREQGRTVRRYLEALEAHRPKRGRKRTTESIQSRIERLTGELPGSDPLSRLLLLQEKADLERELEVTSSSDVLETTEEEFIKVAKDFSVRRGVTYDAWRQVGVDPKVLKAAGIARSA
jgi:hypothetical protein